MNARSSKLEPAPVPTLVSSVFLGWLVPGLGHWTVGHRRQGVMIAVLVGGIFVVGLFLSHFEAVSRDLHPFSFGAQVFVGGGTIPLLYLNPARDKVLTGMQSIKKPRRVPRYTDTGVLFCNIAGLLNLLVLFDLIDRQVEPRAPRRKGATA